VRVTSAAAAAVTDGQCGNSLHVLLSPKESDAPPQPTPLHFLLLLVCSSYCF
jgi:hypothetical protein